MGKKYSAKAAAREFMPKVVAALEDEVANGKGMARTTAAQTLIKLAELESVVETEQDVEIRFVEIDADPSGKIIQLPRFNDNGEAKKLS